MSILPSVLLACAVAQPLPIVEFVALIREGAGLVDIEFHPGPAAPR